MSPWPCHCPIGHCSVVNMTFSGDDAILTKNQNLHSSIKKVRKTRHFQKNGFQSLDQTTVYPQSALRKIQVSKKLIETNNVQSGPKVYTSKSTSKYSKNLNDPGAVLC